MADISKIKLPSGSVYEIKDAVARQTLAGAIKVKGTTTTALTDEGTTNPITISGESYTAVANDAVFYNKKEYVFDGTKWHEFGDMSGLGALAVKDSVSTSYTPAGSVSKPTFTGSEMTSTGNYTPAGSVTVSTNATTNKTATVAPASSGTATYTPAGSVTFTKAKSTVTPAASGDATYTPAGSVAAPTISVKTAGATTTVKNPTKVTVAKTVVAAAPGATAPANALTYYDVNGETLSLYQLGYTTGDSITTANVTVKTGDAAYSASAPAFTGTGVRLETDSEVPSAASFGGTGVRLVTGNIPVPSTYTASFTGTEATLSVEGTPSGDVSKPTFTGTQATITVS